MNTTPNLTDPYDPMAGTLAGSYARAGMFQDEPFPPLGVVEQGAPTVPDVPGDVPWLNVNILALDLGTKTGFALRRRDGSTRHGTEVFTPRKSWSEGQKWARYRAWLAGFIHEEQIHRVVYELVIRHEVKGRPLWDAAHAYGAFQAITHMVCDGFNVTATGVNLATVKKSFTGSGRANKTDMIAEARARGFRPESDNDADALAILHWAVAQERKA